MRYRTALALFCGAFCSGWLCLFFIHLFFNGEYLVREHSRLIAGIEVLATAGIVALCFERLIRLREKR